MAANLPQTPIMTSVTVRILDELTEMRHLISTAYQVRMRLLQHIAPSLQGLQGIPLSVADFTSSDHHFLSFLYPNQLAQDIAVRTTLGEMLTLANGYRHFNSLGFSGFLLSSFDPQSIVTATAWQWDQTAQHWVRGQRYVNTEVVYPEVLPITQVPLLSPPESYSAGATDITVSLPNIPPILLFFMQYPVLQAVLRYCGMPPNNHRPPRSIHSDLQKCNKETVEAVRPQPSTVATLLCCGFF